MSWNLDQISCCVRFLVPFRVFCVYIKVELKLMFLILSLGIAFKFKDVVLAVNVVTLN